MDQMNKKTPLVNRSEKNPLFMEKKSFVDGSKKIRPTLMDQKKSLLMDQKMSLDDGSKKASC